MNRYDRQFGCQSFQGFAVTWPYDEFRRRDNSGREWFGLDRTLTAYYPFVGLVKTWPKPSAAVRRASAEAAVASALNDVPRSVVPINPRWFFDDEQIVINVNKLNRLIVDWLGAGDTPYFDHIARRNPTGRIPKPDSRLLELAFAR